MSPATPLKTRWTWLEWQESRAARRAVADRVGPPIVRREQSSSDRRLRNAFDGNRGPAFRSADARPVTRKPCS